jgi:hypothetical protein
MRVMLSAAAASYIAGHGGELWVWAARPRMCCGGSPAWMHAATRPPADLTGFAVAAQPDGVRVHFRPTAGQTPDVLEVAMTGKRNPQVAAYWDGCLMAMT